MGYSTGWGAHCGALFRMPWLAVRHRAPRICGRSFSNSAVTAGVAPLGTWMVMARSVKPALDGMGAAVAYDAVYCIEMILLLATLVTMLPLIRPWTKVVPEPVRRSFDAHRTATLGEMERP